MTSFFVGEKRPETIPVGIVERGTGSSIVKEHGETLALRGTYGFPNKVQVWAQRVINGKVPTDKDGNPIEVAVNDPAYKGELKQLKWGATGGSLIDVRYLKGYNTLDVLFQETRLNFKVDENNEASADVYMLQLPGGDYDVDENIEPLLVQHLKWHKFNGDSISKDPSFYTEMFREKNFEQQETMESKVLDEKFEARKIIDSYTGGEEISKMKNLFAVVAPITDEKPDDTKIYAYLKMIADKKPTAFIKSVEDFKKKLSNLFVKLESYEAIDLTKDGTVAAGMPGKKMNVIVSDLPVKGKEIADYFLVNFADPIIYDAIFKLTQITDKLN